VHLRSKLTGRVVEARISYEYYHPVDGYPLLVARLGATPFPIPWLDSVIYEVVRATEEEWAQLLGAGYSLEYSEV
jgi:hypothetical protein